MADNVTFQATAATPASGTVVATDDVGGAHYQVVKLALGLNNAVDTHLDSGQQTMANSVPVTLASDSSDIKITLDGETVAISGTVQVQSNSANLATQATAALIQAAVETIDNAISGSEMQVDIVSGGPIGATTDAEAAGDGSVIAILKRLRTLLGGTLTVSGTVTANAGSGTFTVDSELPAAAALADNAANPTAPTVTVPVTVTSLFAPRLTSRPSAAVPGALSQVAHYHRWRQRGRQGQ